MNHITYKLRTIQARKSINKMALCYSFTWLTFWWFTVTTAISDHFPNKYIHRERHNIHSATQLDFPVSLYFIINVYSPSIRVARRLGERSSYVLHRITTYILQCIPDVSIYNTI